MRLLLIPIAMTAILTSGCGQEDSPQSNNQAGRLSKQSVKALDRELGQVAPASQQELSGKERTAQSRIISRYAQSVPPGPCRQALERLGQSYLKDRQTDLNNNFGQAVAACTPVETR